MNIKNLIKNSNNKFPLFEREILLSKIIKKTREFIITHNEYNLSTRELKQYTKLAKKRIKGWPLSYLTGEKEFYGLNFIVDKNVLIPRPETELIVEETIKLLNKKNNYLIIDIGTGSGCIIITIAKQILNLKIKNFNLIGIDISNKSINIAKQNAKLNKVDKYIRFIKGDLLKPLINKIKINNNLAKNFYKTKPYNEIIIIANLPYLTPKQVDNSPTIKFEPRRALIGGQDGLKFYKKLFNQIKSINFKDIKLLLEIDPEKYFILKDIIYKNFPGSKTKLIKDLRKFKRLTVIEIKKSS